MIQNFGDRYAVGGVPAALIGQSTNVFGIEFNLPQRLMHTRPRNLLKPCRQLDGPVATRYRVNTKTFAQVGSRL